MTTIQERLREQAAFHASALGQFQESRDEWKAADEIDRLQAALKASDEALLDVAGYISAGMRGSTAEAIRAARSRAKESQS